MLRLRKPKRVRYKSQKLQKARRLCVHCVYQHSCQWLKVVLCSIYFSVRENVCNNSKNVKSHVFWILKKNVKKRTYSFTGHLVTQPLLLNYREVSTSKSRSPTSNILLRSADTRNYATEMAQKWLRMDLTLRELVIELQYQWSLSLRKVYELILTHDWKCELNFC